MLYRVLADLIVVIHLVFVVFAVFGGLLLLWRKRLAWIHVPCVLWAVLIEFGGWICPLTPFENLLREKSGALGHEVGFIEHFILPLLYPAMLTRRLQVVLGFFVLFVNLLTYGWLFRQIMKARD